MNQSISIHESVIKSELRTAKKASKGTATKIKGYSLRFHDNMTVSLVVYYSTETTAYNHYAVAL